MPTRALPASNGRRGMVYCRAAAMGAAQSLTILYEYVYWDL